jgi:Skp family chaperone for outer membrane proteins
MPKRKLTKEEEKALDDELDFELEEIRKTEVEIVPPQEPQKTRVETLKKENIMKRKPVLTAVVITVIVTLSLVFAGFKTYEYIYNLGVQSEIDRQANITEEVVKAVERLKP